MVPLLLEWHRVRSMSIFVHRGGRFWNRRYLLGSAFTTFTWKSSPTKKPTRMSPIMAVRSRNIADASGERDTMSVSGHHQTSDDHLNEKWPQEHTRSIRLASHAFGSAITTRAA